jgi:type IV pilus assembly protein PilM
MLFFESKPTQFVGIDIGSSGIKLVELRGVSKRPYVFTYAFSDGQVDFRFAKTDEARAATIDATAALIKQVAQSAKTVSTAAVASLSQRDVFSTIITIPKVDPKVFSATIATEVEKLLPFPLAEAMLDTRKIEPLPQEAEQYKNIDRVFVTAARKKMIQMYSDIFSRAGFKLQSIETETFATIRSLIGTDPSPVLIIDMGKQITSMSYVVRTVPHVETAIEIGGDKVNELLGRAWNKTPLEVEGMKIDLFDAMGDEASPEIAQLLDPVYRPLLKGIEGVFASIQQMQMTSMTRPDKIILIGGASHCPQLAQKIEAQFSIKTFVADPWSRVVAPAGLKPVLDRIAPRFAVAIGLAERMIVS